MRLGKRSHSCFGQRSKPGCEQAFTEHFALFQVKREHIKLIKVPSRETSPSNQNSGHKASSESPEVGAGDDGNRNHSRKNSSHKSRHVVNNMEHRHNAQQKILEQQQKQIKDQQRLIEELTYLQKQQMMQQQLTTQVLLQQQIGAGNNVAADGQVVAKGSPDNEKAVAKPPDAMATHLGKLQKDLVSDGTAVNAR